MFLFFAKEAKKMCLKTIRTKSLKNPKTWIFFFVKKCKILLCFYLVHGCSQKYGFVKKCKILLCFYLVHGCSQKYEVWPCLFFFCKISQKNVFENILETKKTFEDYNIEKLKKSKNWDFSKGVSPWFGSKL